MRDIHVLQRAQHGIAADAFGPELVRFPMFVWALAQLNAVVGPFQRLKLLSPHHLSSEHD